MAKVSFEKDIVPMFYEYRGPMLWRFDLIKYEDVKANAPMIYDMINGGGMPPTPFPPFSGDQINTFARWMTDDYPR